MDRKGGVDLKEIALTKEKVAFVDDDVFPIVSQFKWRALKSRHKFYAVTEIRERGKYITIYMHRLILNAHDDVLVDHKDGNGLNNLRDNLRESNNTQNQQNRSKQSNNTSGFKGVTRSGSKWKSCIGVSGKMTYLGTFETAELAASAYDKAAIEKYGSFAKLNLPDL